MSKVNDAIDDAIGKKIKEYLYKFFRATTTICITATLAVSVWLYNCGVYLYNNSEATKAAIDTFIEVKKRNDKI